MNQFAKFVACVHAIAHTDQPETMQKMEIETLLRQFTAVSQEAHSGEPHGTERVQKDVSSLHDYLISEVNRRHPEQLGVLIQHAHGLVIQELRRHHWT